MRLIDSPRTACACKCGEYWPCRRLNLFDDKRYLRAGPALGCHPYLVNSVGGTPVKHSRRGRVCVLMAHTRLFASNKCHRMHPLTFILSCSPRWLINQNANRTSWPHAPTCMRAEPKEEWTQAAAVRLERKLRPLSAHYGANEGDFGSMACVGAAQWRALRKRFFYCTSSWRSGCKKGADCNEWGDSNIYVCTWDFLGV
jgi:hypothetical protein